MLFRLSSPVLVLVVSIVIIGSTVLGFLLGRALDRRREGLREPLGVTQGALVGFVALLLAFGLTMAVGRYESRRAAVVTEANAIGTTYLRAQTLTEPVRSESLALIKQYTDLRIRLDHEVPGSKQFDETSDESQRIQNQLWGLAGDALNASPVDSAPRLYVETLNDMIDAHTTRVSALDNRIPTSVWLLQIVATAVALASTRHVRGDARPRRVHGVPRSRADHHRRAGHVRSRPAESRLHPRAGDSTRRAQGLDGSASGGGRAGLVTLARRQSGVTTSRLSSEIAGNVPVQEPDT